MNKIFNIKNEKLFIDNNEIFLISKSSIKIMESYWKPIMEEHAKISNNNIDILEIGFGMGYFSNYIQNNYNINTHTIVEIHPQIIEKIKEWMKDKNNVILIEGDWYEMQDEIKKRKYDYIYYDSVLDINKNKFKKLLFEIGKNKFIFSYFDPLKNDIIYIPYVEIKKDCQN
jgi:tRNA G46 methylase TrmB